MRGQAKNNGANLFYTQEEEEQTAQLKKSIKGRRKKQVKVKKQCWLWDVIGIFIILCLLIILGFLAYDLYQKRIVTKNLISILKSSQFAKSENTLISIDVSSAEKQLKDKKISQQHSPITQTNLHSDMMNQTELQEIDSVLNQEFIIPKYVWVFVESPKTESYFIQRCLVNLKWFSEKTEYKFNIVNSSNYGQWIPEDRKKKIDDLFKQIQLGEDKKELREQIKIELIMMEIMLQKGGVIVDKNIMFTQDLEWLKNINSNIYNNRGSFKNKATAKFFGFFNLNYGPQFAKQNKKTRYLTDQFMVLFPGWLKIFFAGVPQGEYLKQTIEWFHRILKQPSRSKEWIAEHTVNTGWIQGNNPQEEALVLASQIVIQKKHKQLNIGNMGQTIFAIDYYGLLTINSKFFPTKLEAFFQKAFEEKVYKNLAKITLQELQQSVGPLRYAVSMLFEQHMNYRLQGAKNGNPYYNMHPESFFARFLFMDGNYPFIWADSYEKSVVNATAKKWQSLPKIVWLFWDKGISKSTLANKLCVENIKKYAGQVGFQIKMVNNSNIEAYIGKQTIERIDNIADSRKIQTFAPLKSNYYRIALVAKYGGVYMDVSFFAIQNFDWLVNIGQYPSQFVFNRYGELPRIFMLFHPHFGQPFEFSYDPRANTKMMWLSAYQNNLIIAEPNQKLFEDWFNEYELFITSPYEQTENKMRQYQVFADRWTNKKDTYLASMDSLKNTLGRKQQEIIAAHSKDGPQSAPEYYGIWSMSGFRGQQKFRPHTNYIKNNFRNPYSSDNVLLYRYSKQYTDGIIGKVHQFGKLYSWSIKHLNTFIEKNIDDNFQSQTHPDSYFRKYLYDTSRLRIERRNEELVIVT